MSILTNYILKKYLMNFIIVLISLEIFFVGIDFLQNFKSIPQSANLQLLYLLYNGFFTLTLALPLSIVFGWIITLIVFIKNNEFVAFNALGATNKNIYLPVMGISILLLTSMMILQMTPLAYSSDQKARILDNQYFTNTKSDIFLKYNDYYVYFKKLLPLEKKAQDIHIFKVLDNDVVESIIADEAYFQDDKWNVLNAKIVTKPKDLDMQTSKIEVRYEKSLNTLEGFKPKILDNVYDKKSDFSIIDAISAIKLLKEQGIKTDKIRSILYNLTIVPFFIIPFILLIFAYASLNSRFFNMGKFTSIWVFGTLTVWGVFFLLYKFTNGGIVIPEVSILLPMVLWLTISISIYNKKINSY